MAGIGARELAAATCALPQASPASIPPPAQKVRAVDWKVPSALDGGNGDSSRQTNSADARRLIALARFQEIKVSPLQRDLRAALTPRDRVPAVHDRRAHRDGLSKGD